jgi:hypothetical protein
VDKDVSSPIVAANEAEAFFRVVPLYCSGCH